MTLTAKSVTETFMSCLFTSEEDTTGYVEARGIMLGVGFHPGRLKESTPKIQEMLDELPDEFKKDLGGGMSFLNMCNDKHDNQWADLHETMDQLVCLGLAIEKLSFAMPREIWKVLPGGMPYIIIS